MVSCTWCQHVIVVCVAHWDFMVGQDQGSCGKIGSPYRSGIGFYGLRPGSGLPGVISLCDQSQSGGPQLTLTLTLTLGCWVFGSVGSGWTLMCSTYIYIHWGSFVGCTEGSFRGLAQGDSSIGKGSFITLQQPPDSTCCYAIATFWFICASVNIAFLSSLLRLWMHHLHHLHPFLMH